MKIVVLKAGKEDEVLEELLTSIKEVLKELQVEIEEIRLNQIPYYQGYDTPQIKEIFTQLDQAVGVVMASRVELLSVSGSLCTFFEYCSGHKGSEMFKKPVFALTSSDWRGEREAAEYILHAWDILGGTEYGKLGTYTPTYKDEKDQILKNAERMTEDFYRVIKQNRVPIKSSDYSIFTKKESQVTSSFEQQLKNETKKYKDPDLPENSTQEQDIENLANLFKKQLSHFEDTQLAVPEPQLKSIKHMLGSLPHYFQAQYDSDFKGVVQYHLLSEEDFSGYLTIEDGDCVFTEGVYPGADVELTAQEEVIEEILTKKLTAQKAFMLGQLKVRGNFMLLAKIDQMFKAM